MKKLSLVTIIALSFFSLKSFAQCPDGMSLAPVSLSFTSVSSADPSWVVPGGVTQITLTTTGASGGSGYWSETGWAYGGSGAVITGVVNVTPGDNISIITGTNGYTEHRGYGGSGGGGTYVWDATTGTLLQVSGGGGGGASLAGGDGYDDAGGDGQTNIATLNDPTTDAAAVCAAGGSGGNGGNVIGTIYDYDCSGGAGWNSNGIGTSSYCGGLVIGGDDPGNGSFGGTGGGTYYAPGGFGGGGAGIVGGGGGGGYNGGGGGSFYNGGGGGGGSYCAGTVTATSLSTGNGSVTINYGGGLTATDLTCNSSNTGSISAAAPTGGIPPYTYLWAPGGGTNLTISNLSAGSYTLTITDANGCSISASTSVAGSSFAANASATTNVLCFGGSDGSATSSVTGGIAPYTYSWSDATSATTASVSNLTAGTYTVTVQDNTVSCSVTASVAISQPTQFLYASAGTISEVTCNGGANGHVSVSPVGGNLPYTYAWSNGITTVSASQAPNTLSAGSYTVTVMDNCGATHTATATVTQPNDMRDSVSAQTNIVCGGGNGGSATVGAKGGTYPYTYSWSNSATLSTATGLSAGTYSVLITDKNGCTNSVTGITITQPTTLISNLASISYPLCNGESSGAASVNVSGGSSPYSYTWAPNVSTTSSASNVLAGTYTVSVKDAHRCTTSLVIVITQPLALRDSAVKSLTVNISCSGGNNGSITMGTKYGTSPYHYLWSPNTSCTTATASGLSAGTYTIGVQDANGCSSSFTTVTITQPATILRDSISLTTNVGCHGGNGGAASVGARGGASPYTYAWSNGKTTYSISGLTAGGYTVTITDKAGCSNTLSVTVTQPATAVGSTISVNCGAGQGAVTLTASGGTPAYTYLWSDAKTSSSIIVANGTYTVKVSDAHGCSATNSVTVACGAPEIKNRSDDNKDAPSQCCGGLENISLYPNPNNGQFTIQSSVVSGQLSVEIYNMLGQKVYAQFNIQNPTFNINISSQPNGIYLIRILDNTGNLVSQKKVVKTN